MAGSIGLIAIGLVALFFGGDSLVKGAARLASAFGVPALVVGLTVVAFGTSVPELLVSIDSALKGVSGVALGNVIGSNIANVALILGVIAAIVVIVGGVCVYAVIQFQRGFQQVVTEVMNDPTVQAALNDPTLQAAFADPTFQAAFQTGGSFDGFASERLPSGATSRGPLMPNQTGRAEVDTFVDDSWIFNADAGAAYTVEVIATDSDLDPQLAVYGADSQLVGANDDIDGMDNLNSRLQFTASQNGIYTIIVSAFGQGGGYEVIVRR